MDELAKSIGCDTLHADKSAEEREASFNSWVRGTNKFMVCSSLLGCGVDIEGVKLVLHFGTPWSILDFAQESGQAGWSGNPSQSVVFARTDELEPIGNEDPYGAKLMHKWARDNSQCCRLLLSSFLDGRRVTCMALKGAVLCDLCRAESEQTHPMELKFLTPDEGVSNIPKLMKRPHIPLTSVEYEMVWTHSAIQQ